MNRYELTYIINTAVEETARKELIEKFTELITQNGGEIEKVDESWGKRRLAYPINDMPDGYYVLTTFTADGTQNKEIQRNLEISDNILRYLIIKLLDKKQSVKPKAVRPAPVPVVVRQESTPKPAVPVAPAAPAVATAPVAKPAPAAKAEALAKADVAEKTEEPKEEATTEKTE